MKAKIAIAVSALTISTITTAHADLYIQSPRGISQTEWNNSDTYKNFICPSGYGRGEGVDMNFTTTRADDFYFVECSPIVVAPMPIYTTTPVTPTPTPQTDTATVTTTVSATTPTTSNTTPVVTETTTATTASVTIQSLYAQIMALFTQLLALIVKING